MEYIIETENLIKQYGTATVVDNINIHVPKGKIYALLGRNGPEERSKGLVAPMITSAIMVMGSAALCNQDFGALYPWTVTYFLIKGRIESTGYPISLAIAIIILVSVIGFYTTFHYFKKEDLK